MGHYFLDRRYYVQEVVTHFIVVTFGYKLGNIYFLAIQ